MIFKSNIASSEKFGRQANAQQPQSSGITSSEKMKTVTKWPLVPLMILLAFCMATYSNAQTYNYIDMTAGSANVYDHNTPSFITTGADNNAVFGNIAGFNITSGAQNALFGGSAGVLLMSGSYNSFMGAFSGPNENYGSYNTFTGYNSGNHDQQGTYNTSIGYYSGFGSGSLTDATAIGSNATASYSDEMVFGDGNVTLWGFGGDVTQVGAALQVGTSGSSGNGAYLTTGGTWTNVSDVNKKENFVVIDENDILSKVDQLPITRWNYKIEGSSVNHIGPMAQDFYSLFHVGNDNKSISTIDPASIALVCIKALDAKNQVLQAQNAQLQSSVSDLQDKFNTVLAEMENLKTLQAQCCGSIGNNSPTGGSNNSGNNSDGQPSLEQNAPNPFTQNTVINYYLPASIPNAVITVRTLTGVAIKSFNITSPGSGQVTLNAGTLAPGTYEYDMISNDQIIGSKKMVINGQ